LVGRIGNIASKESEKGGNSCATDYVKKDILISDAEKKQGGGVTIEVTPAT